MLKLFLHLAKIQTTVQGSLVSLEKVDHLSGPSVKEDGGGNWETFYLGKAPLNNAVEMWVHV